MGLGQQQSQHADAVNGDQQEIVDQHAERAAAPAGPGIHGTARYPGGVQHQPRWVGHSDAHGDGTANGYHPGRDLHTKAQGIAAIVAMDPFQCGAKYSKHDVASDTQDGRIHPVSVVCYFLAGAAGVTGAVIAGLAAGAVAFGFIV